MIFALDARSATSLLRLAYERIGSAASLAQVPAHSAPAIVITINDRPAPVSRAGNATVVIAPPNSRIPPIANSSGCTSIGYGVRNDAASIATTITAAPKSPSSGPDSVRIRESGDRSGRDSSGHAHAMIPSASKTASGGNAGMMYGISLPLEAEKVPTITSDAITQ